VVYWNGAHGVLDLTSYASLHLLDYSWLLLRYPVSKSLRAKLVRLYYELALIPGIEPRISRAWVEMTRKLLAHKADGKKKLDASDLILPWKPLWRVVEKELWRKGRWTFSRQGQQKPTHALPITLSLRSLSAVYLNLAEHCKHYYSPDDTPEMLEEFVPMFNQEVYFPL